MIKKLLLLSLALGLGLVGYEITRPDVDNIYSDYRKTVVKLIMPTGGGGTGFAIKAPSGKEYILTNKHVCGDNQTLLVESEALPRKIQMRVIEVSQEHDLCLVEAPYGLEAKSIGLLDLIGSKVFVVGYPRLQPLTPREGHIVGRESIPMASPPVDGECPAGTISEIGWMGLQCYEPYDSNIISVEIHPGNSGSPLINRQGNIIGVVFAGNTVHGAAVPLKYINSFLALY